MPATVKNSMGFNTPYVNFSMNMTSVKRQCGIMRYNCPLAYFLKSDFIKLIYMIMKQRLHLLYKRFWKPMKKWIRSIVKGRDDDDNNFSHPFAIF